MIHDVKFFVPGTPRAKQSFRYAQGGSYQRTSVKQWEGTVAQYAMIAMTGQDRFDGKTQVLMDFYLPLTTKKGDKTKAKIDLDNLSKAVLDGLKGVAFEDDDLVVELHLYKHLTDDLTGVNIFISRSTI